MLVRKLFEGFSREDALDQLRRHPYYALSPIQIRHEDGRWVIAEIVASKILNQTLFILIGTLNQYIATPEEYPGFYSKLNRLLKSDPTLKGFAYRVAEEFDALYPDLFGDEYLTALDNFLEGKIKTL